MKTIYFSEHLALGYRKLFTCLESILIRHNYKVNTLKMTKDIWIRDFMPLKLDTEYIQYIYNPDYLQNKHNSLFKTNPSSVVKELNLDCRKIELILDGGNIVKHNNIMIMTDKVLTENNITEKELKEFFPKQRIVLIPRDPDKEEVYGHTDGMVRFVSQNHLLVNNHYNDEFKQQLHNVLKDAGFQLTELKVKEETTYSWGYINFLHINNLIIQPSIDKVNDEYVQKQLEKLYPSTIVEQCPARKLARLGGVFNCISWEN